MTDLQFGSGESLQGPALTDVLEQSIVGTYIIQNDTFAFVNQTFGEWFGYQPSEIVGKKSPEELTAPDDREKVNRNIRNRMDGKETSLQYSFTALKKDGSTFQAEVHGTITRYEGEPAIVGTLRRVGGSDQAKEVIEDLAWGVANHTGKAFYRLLVVHLASCLNVEYAYIGEYFSDPETIDNLAFYNDGELSDNYQYPIDHPTCKEILRSGSCRYENGRLDFPNDDFFQTFDGEGFFGTTLINSVGEVLGIIWVMSSDSLSDYELTRDVLQIFADRAGAEVDRHRTEIARERSEEKYGIVFDSVKDAILVLDSSSGKILNANKKSCEMFNCSEEDLVDTEIGDFSFDKEGYDTETFLGKANQYKENNKHFFEWWLETETGEGFWGEVTTNFAKFNDETHIIAVIRDVNIRVKTEDALSNPSPLDPVTDSASRAYFYQELEEALADQVSERSTAVLFLDIDEFKKVNNAFGRAIGDRILAALSRQMQSRLGDKGILSRWGGDEFVILLPEVLDVPNAESIARELLDIYENPVGIAGENFRLSASVGMALYPQDADDAGELVSNAELAMFKSKKTKGNTYKVFTEETSRSIERRFELETNLRSALEMDQFEVHYQPQFHFGNKMISGMEALIRWRHPHKGFLQPNEFVPVAESKGLIEKIDSKVIHEATEVVKTLNENFNRDLRLSVNVSPYDFEQRKLTKIVNSALDKSGLLPENLVLEITETVAMKDVEFTSEILKKLKKAGVEIALDDFGTGYASFSSLSRLPIDVLKIDRSLVNIMGTKKEEFEVVKIINPLAKELDVRVIAEGVETETQLNLLRKWECDEVQGFLMSRPLPNLNFYEFLEMNPTIDEAVNSQSVFTQEIES